MADDITYTSSSPAGVPSATKQATDEHATRGHMPIVKLAYSADGTATHVPADADGLLVNLGTNNDVTVTGTVAVTQSGTWDEIGINDSGNSITVDGTVTANAGTNLNTSALLTEADFDTKTGALTETAPATDTASSGLNGRLQRIAQRITSLIALLPTSLGQKAKTASLAVVLASDQDALPITDNSGSLTVDNGGTFAVQAAQSGTWNINNLSGTVSLPTGASTLAEQQTQTTHLATIAGDTTDIETAVELIDDTVATLGTTTYSEATTKGLIIGAVRRDADTTLVDTTNEVGPLQMDASGRLKVEAFSGETLPVSLASVPSHAVTNAGTFVTQLDGTALTRLTDIETNTDSAAVVGNGAAATAQRVTLANDSTGIVSLAAGTNVIGKLLPPDVDVTTHTNYAKKYYTNAGAVTDGIIWSPAAGKRFHVVSMYINVSAAATVTLEDDKAGGDEAIWKGEYAANSGVTIYFGEKYPLASGEDAADLLITTSAGNVYVTVTGYEI
jgi:hypothetical protein